MSYRLVLGALAAAGLHSAAATALPSPAAAAMIEPGDAQLRGYDAFVRAGALQIAIAPDRLAVCPRARPAACVAMAIDGAAPYRWPEFGRPQRSRSHYLRGSDPAHWRVGVPHYGLLRYREVLPGVDWVLRTDGARLRYDFELQPGADPGRIRLRFTGARPALDDDSALVLDTPAGRLRHSDLNVFRVTVPGRQPVPARFRLAGDGVVEFDLRGRPTATALLIDPLLDYSSYLGGSSADGAHDVTTDDDGYVYVVGGTDSADFPLASPLQPALAGADDGYVAKFTPDGSALVWATYIGGTGAERLTAVALAADGSIALGGWTQSADFPTLAAFQSTFAGGDNNQDAVVLKLKPPGDALEFSSYLGGLDTNVYPEEVRGIAVDTTGAIHVTGSTGARSFPVTVPFLGRGCLLDDAAIGLDAFYTRVSASGALQASTCLGGAGWDVGRAVALGRTTPSTSPAGRARRTFRRRPAPTRPRSTARATPGSAGCARICRYSSTPPISAAATTSFWKTSPSTMRSTSMPPARRIRAIFRRRRDRRSPRPAARSASPSISAMPMSPSSIRHCRA